MVLNYKSFLKINASLTDDETDKCSQVITYNGVLYSCPR